MTRVLKFNRTSYIISTLFHIDIGIFFFTDEFHSVVQLLFEHVFLTNACVTLIYFLVRRRINVDQVHLCPWVVQRKAKPTSFDQTKKSGTIRVDVIINVLLFL